MRFLEPFVWHIVHWAIPFTEGCRERDELDNREWTTAFSVPKLTCSLGCRSITHAPTLEYVGLFSLARCLAGMVFGLLPRQHIVLYMDIRR